MAKALKQRNWEFCTEPTSRKNEDFKASCKNPCEYDFPAILNALVDVSNEEEQAEPAPEQAPPKKKSRARSVVAECLFYLILIIVIAAAFTVLGGNGNMPRSLFGYAASTVLTGSMQSELPKGSLILTRRVDPAALAVDDNITFLNADNTTTTHKIVGVYENYDGTALRAFVTQGTENGMADDDVVMADNVVGKVVWHSPALGKAVNYVKGNALFIGVITMLVIGFAIALRMFIKSGKKQPGVV